MKPGRQPYRLGVRIATAIASGTVSLLIAEGLVRLFLPFGMMEIDSAAVRLSENPRLLYELNPGHPEHNRMGLRGKDLPLAKPDGVLRIAVLGDSLAYGPGLETSETIPAQLERLLNHAVDTSSKRFEVLNLGVPGYSIIQEAEQLRARGLELEPDLAVLVVCQNDWDAHTFQFEALLATRADAEMRFLSQLYDPANTRLRRLLYRSHLFRWIAYHLERLAPRAPVDWGHSYRDQDGMAVAATSSVQEYYGERPFYLEHFRRLSKLLEERGIPLIVVLSPWKLDDGYSSRLRELAALCLQPMCSLVDLPFSPDAGGDDGLVPTDDIYMEDGVHLTEHGNRLMATVLAERALALLRDDGTRH